MLLLGALSEVSQNASAQGKERACIRQFSVDAIGKKLQAWTDIANELGVRKIDFLDCRRQISDMEHGRAAGTHDERRLLHGVVSNSDDKISAVDRLVHIVALGQGRRSHVEPRAA